MRISSVDYNVSVVHANASLMWVCATRNCQRFTTPPPPSSPSVAFFGTSMCVSFLCVRACVSPCEQVVRYEHKKTPGPLMTSKGPVLCT